MARWARYTFRMREGPASTFLDKLQNRSEFIRRAIENEIADRSAVAAPAPEDRETVERLARLERAVGALSADMKQVLGEIRATAASGWRQPPAAEASEQARTDAAEDDGRPSQEELNQVLSDILNFGQKGGDER